MDIGSVGFSYFELNEEGRPPFYLTVLMTLYLYTYQDEFDVGKNRDSNFVYGPAQPRTVFVGVKFRL